MGKSNAIANASSCSWLLVLLLALGATATQSARLRSQRQEALPDAAAAPYPAADDLKPDIPFEEGVAAAPDQAYGPPDLTYGPPTPDQTYGAPDNAVEQLPSAQEPEDFTPDPEAEEIQPADQAPAQLRRGQRQQQRRRQQRLLLLNSAPAPAAVQYVQPLRLLSAAQAVQLGLW